MNQFACSRSKHEIPDDHEGINSPALVLLRTSSRLIAAIFR